MSFFISIASCFFLLSKPKCSPFYDAFPNIYISMRRLSFLFLLDTISLYILEFTVIKSLNSESKLVLENSDDSLIASWLIFSTRHDYFTDSKVKAALVWILWRRRNFFRSSYFVNTVSDFDTRSSCCFFERLYLFLEQLDSRHYR